MQNPYLRIFSRLLVLNILLLSLELTLRNGGRTLIASTKEASIRSTKDQAPIVTVDTQETTPLVLSSPRVLSIDSQFVEFAFDLRNASSKVIQAYAIRQEVLVDGSRTNIFLFSNLVLAGKSFETNLFATNFGTCDVKTGKDQRIILSVDYVEFADGTTWGSDMSASAETSAGQRAAAMFLTSELVKILNSSGIGNVVNVIKGGKVNNDPPSERSEQWKQGYRSGMSSVTERLKRAHNRGGSNQLEHELRQLSAKLNGAQ